ncbi:hypothetical protein [Paenibacillus terrae]|uniref:hypothetical protein n=1 Tax=Paenibacillus terrae TaxID=159743 RepID=UPI001F18463E|nr:hypothetical protein [Paenibacillus terrae]
MKKITGVLLSRNTSVNAASGKCPEMIFLSQVGSLVAARTRQSAQSEKGSGRNGAMRAEGSAVYFKVTESSRTITQSRSLRCTVRPAMALSLIVFEKMRR